MESDSPQPKPHPKRLKTNRIDEGSSDPLPIPNLPEELIQEILLRLPAKSMGKFKCVSKSWLSLISSKEFIKTHLAIASRRDDYEHHSLIFSVYPQHFNDYFRSCLVNFHAESPETETACAKVSEIRSLVKNKSIWPIGSCDGLICLRNMYNDLFLCNPCTKQITKLPKMKGIDCALNFGFGYDRLNCDYKIVALIPTAINNRFELKVYSLKSKSWRGIKDPKVSVRGNQLADYLQHASGKLHWLIIDDLSVSKIASFDLANETYVEEIDLPNSKGGYHYRLGLLGDDLSLLYNHGTRVDVWVMKEFWTEIVSIPYVRTSFNQGPYGTQVLATLRNGEILCLRDSYLLLYNPKTNISRRFLHIGDFGCTKVMDLGHLMIGNVTLCVESLLSPDI
ncbi:OLC1v1019316C1 [Oldenlandia corymbosa var. corymbosa]|uniref:OLC1v1019316C1 n=1 Tax=Oldenlandia corymbosa var. corymbosa TaxID=529605 RepID=A0AAV1EDL7_OLDCO|nr:OLC1v1019316C1 [Oldenlandia corymbosa var. corymbosa]